MDRRSQPPRRLLALGAGGAALCLSWLPGTGLAQDAAGPPVQLQSEGMNVYGQSELPKVLYIVPWKRRQAAAIDIPAGERLTADVLQTIEPEIFRRQIQYHSLIRGQRQSPEP